MTVRFTMSPLFKETYARHARGAPGLAAKFDAFISAKTQAPIQQFGKNDTLLISTGPLGRSVPGLRHAHLSQDLSVFYTIEGRNPTLIKLYGIFSHKESGTSNNANIKVQKNLGQQLSNQVFTD